MRKHSDYIKFFKEITQKHRGFKAKKDENFCYVPVSPSPFLELTLGDLMGKLRNDVEFPLMVLLGSTINYQDSGADNMWKKRPITFFLLDTVTKNDFEGMQEAFDRMEVLGDEIIAYILRYAAVNDSTEWFERSATSMQDAGPIGDNLYGKMITLRFNEVANHIYRYNDIANWQDVPLPIDSEE